MRGVGKKLKKESDLERERQKEYLQKCASICVSVCVCVLVIGKENKRKVSKTEIQEKKWKQKEENCVYGEIKKGVRKSLSRCD